jgi:hypothetical protein
MKNTFTIGISILLILILFACGEEEKSAAEINVELQGIELEIYEKIANNQKEEALQLLKTLNHPSDEKWEEKQKQSSFESFLNGGNTYYTYNEWWSEKRNELRELVLGSEKGGDPTLILQKNDDLSQVGMDTAGKITLLKTELVGTYINRNDNGEIKFYKILNVKDEFTKIIHQDNTGGIVNIKSYLIESFDQNYLTDNFDPNSGIIIACNENNRSEKIRLKLTVSSNIKELTDPSGQVYVLE